MAWDELYPVAGTWTLDAPAIDNNTGTLQAIAAAAAQAYNVPASLLQWQIGQESSWNPQAQNGTAYGIAQFQPGTAAQYGVNPADPVSSLMGAAKYDSDLYAQTGDWGQVLQKYGTVGSSSSPSLIARANAALAAIGASPIGGGGSGSPSSWGGILSDPTGIFGTWDFATGPVSDKVQKLVFGYSVQQIVWMVLGLLLIAGGLYTLKPVQTVVNETARRATAAAQAIP